MLCCWCSISDKSLVCCWCYHKYMLAMRLEETPFLCFMPCSAFDFRVKVRTQFALMVSAGKRIDTSFRHAENGN
ncbi:hypothetical protein DPMN_123519 [Dreissena polymorpha]|uniref:Uncharacterized protein n=1 Tax=Dreissena polymorpha TaxID=45954 RepID=A0A9D4JVF3_DREPO|nr:hypothetical protein DPMN_123519 [Dreissena polymorpha]